MYVQTLRKARNKSENYAPSCIPQLNLFISYCLLLYDSRFFNIKHSTKTKLFMNMQVSSNNTKRLLC